MSIFGFGKRLEEESKSSCCCGGNITPEIMQTAEEEKSKTGVKILGGGCAKCNQLEAATIEALKELGMDTTIEHVKDYEKIEQFGSIRSTRTTNVMLSGEWNAILVHDGGPFYIDNYIGMPYCNNLSGGFARYSNGKPSEFTEYVTYESYTNPNTGKSFAG